MRQNINGDNYAEVVTVVSPIDSVFDDSANDSDKSWVVPGGAMWKLNFAHVILVTSADVGNRQIRMSVENEDGDEIIDVTAGTVQAASLTRHYVFLQGIYRETTFIDTELQVPIPQDLYLGPGYTLRFRDAAAIAAAVDDMTVSFQYKNFDV